MRKRSDLYEGLLKQDNQDLNKLLVQYKLIRCFSSTERHDQACICYKRIFEGKSSFIFASSLIQLERHTESTERVYLLLGSQRAFASEDPKAWSFWQRKA